MQKQSDHVDRNCLTRLCAATACLIMSGKELRHASHRRCSEAKRAASILPLQLSAKGQ